MPCLAIRGKYAFPEDGFQSLLPQVIDVVVLEFGSQDTLEIVRFYCRYGWWTIQVRVSDGVALQLVEAVSGRLEEFVRSVIFVDSP